MAKIKSTLTSQMQTKTWQAWIAKAKAAADIKYAAGYDPDLLDRRTERVAVAVVIDDPVAPARRAVSNRPRT